MYYYLAHIPGIDSTDINTIRIKYDPNYQFVAPHIAVVFPIDSSIGKGDLISHISKIITNIPVFSYSLSSLTKSWDHYLYLNVITGREQFINLHDQLYTALLAPHLFKDVGYSPHITLGFFADRQAKFDKSDIDNVIFDQPKYDQAFTEAANLSFNYNLLCSELSLISRVDKLSPGVIEHTFKLSTLPLFE